MAGLNVKRTVAKSEFSRFATRKEQGNQNGTREEEF